MTASTELADYHRRLLADAGRLALLEAALAEVVVPGESVVADIGAGTGVLGILAARLGARRVLLYEREPEVVSWAEEFVAAAGVDGRVILYPEDPRYVLDPEPADVVISETLGNFGPDEGIAVLLSEARRRHLRPGGRLLPGRLDLVLTPVATPALHREIVGWIDEAALPLEPGRLRALALGNAYVRRLGPGDLVPWPEAGRVWTRYDFARDEPGPRSGRVDWTVPAPTVVHGLVHHWRAEFAGRVLATAPDAPPTHWEQVYLPLPEPLDVRPGERLEVEIHADFDDGVEPPGEGPGIAFSWEAGVRDASGRLRQAWSCGVGVPPVERARQT